MPAGLFVPCSREAQENGEFAEALWLCAQCTRAMDELGEELRVVQELTVRAGTCQPCQQGSRYTAHAIGFVTPKKELRRMCIHAS